MGAARREGEELVVAGDAALEAIEGVRAVGSLPRAEYRALVRRARVYVSAPRREEYGIAQLEALADGAILVAAAPGPSYAALSIAQAADPRLVGGDLAGAIRVALDDPLPGYGAAVAPLLERFSPESVDRIVAEGCCRRSPRALERRRELRPGSVLRTWPAPSHARRAVQTP